MASFELCLVFGGRSAEHEISLESTYSIINNLDKNRYNLTLVGIQKSGTWTVYNNDPIKDAKNTKAKCLGDTSTKVVLDMDPNSSFLVDPTGNKTFKRPQAVFPILHGTYGEDGTIQGLLEMAQMPYVGAGLLSSALAMDKAMVKKVLESAGIATAPFKTMHVSDKDDPAFSWDNVTAELGEDLFIKPANLGSSVGISRAQSANAYSEALKLAFEYDHKLIIEKAIRGRELEISVLGNNPYRASLPGEIITKHDFYSYDAKYVDPEGASFGLPADLPESVVKRIQDLAIATSAALCLTGLGRVDLFYDESADQLYINEVNTMPGFTTISMYPKMWGVSGLEYSTLLDELVDLGVQAHASQQQLKTTYY